MINKYDRKGACFLINDALKKGGVDNSDLATQLEEMCYSVSNSNSSTYITLFDNVKRALPEPFGRFLEKSLAECIAEGEISIKEAITDKVCYAYNDVKPRDKYRSLFYKALIKDSRFTKETSGEFAIKIERGCYNSAINHCLESANSYRRQWNSQMFINIYSSRCGLVLSNIDPDGIVAQRINGELWALDRLIKKIWDPESIGAMSAAELCPQVGKHERDTIMKRLNQKVEVKTSALFARSRR